MLPHTDQEPFYGDVLGKWEGPSAAAEEVHIYGEATGNVLVIQMNVQWLTLAEVEIYFGKKNTFADLT